MPTSCRVELRKPAERTLDRPANETLCFIFSVIASSCKERGNPPLIFYSFKTNIQLQTATTFCQTSSNYPSKVPGKRSRSDQGKSGVQPRKPAERTLDRPAYGGAPHLKRDGMDPIHCVTRAGLSPPGCAVPSLRHASSL